MTIYIPEWVIYCLIVWCAITCLVYSYSIYLDLKLKRLQKQLDNCDHEWYKINHKSRTCWKCKKKEKA